jgi:hypothetical protein
MLFITGDQMIVNFEDCRGTFVWNFQRNRSPFSNKRSSLEDKTEGYRVNDELVADSEM